jgi:coenzyme F420 biosynthesis associated uncharacterized protein
MQLVDWELAARVGRRVASDGPRVSEQVAREVVADLEDCAGEAVPLVASVTKMQAPVADNSAVVDRPMWIDSNIAGLERVVAPLAEVLAGRAGQGAAQAASAKVSALQLGAALGWMSGKVLGQYEVLVGSGQQPRLLLVAPNILAAQEAMGVPARDFRLWVCLHEEAHRVQFGSSTWLGDHFAAEVNTFLLAADVSASETVLRLLSVLKALVRVLAGDEQASIVEAVQSPAQREVFDRLSALMSLLEGHAEWVMDAVGPQVIPSLDRLRGGMEERRSNPGTGDGLLRRLLGMDAKLRQYSGGRVFVSTAVDEVGVAGFNRIWESPQTLPTLAEIAEPSLWVARIHGAAA